MQIESLPEKTQDYIVKLNTNELPIEGGLVLDIFNYTDEILNPAVSKPVIVLSNDLIKNKNYKKSQVESELLEEKLPNEGENFKSYTKMLIKLSEGLDPSFYFHIGSIDFNMAKLGFKLPIIFDEKFTPPKFRVLGPGLLNVEGSKIMEIKINSA